ncbi:MauE/DoxX family redox-associated membrane protein [Sphingobacterium sp. SG20118]|uniref:MauE/DoxX family redox-associated membrane protein n=1 Tax=Sphingobacterium sp. SG20118 TaxID=3367156 RepID=UPI0037DFBF5D
MKTRNYIIDTISGIYILTFLFTTINKWSEMPKFLGQMERMPFWDWLAAPVAYGLPTTMGIIALWLALGKQRKIALTIGVGLLIILGVYIILILNYAFGPGYPCSCAGLFDLSWKQQLFLNMSFIALGVTAIFLIRPEDNKPMIIIRHLVDNIIKEIYNKKFNTSNTGQSRQPD